MNILSSKQYSGISKKLNELFKIRSKISALFNQKNVLTTKINQKKKKISLFQTNKKTLRQDSSEVRELKPRFLLAMADASRGARYGRESGVRIRATPGANARACARSPTRRAAVDFPRLAKVA